MRLTMFLLPQQVLLLCECCVDFLRFEMLPSHISFALIFLMLSVPIILVGVGRKGERRQLKLSEVCEPVVVRVIV